MSDLSDLGFDASQVEPASAFDALPAGEYRAALVESKREPTKSGTGELLKLTFQVLGGEYQNRRVIANINIKNASAKAQEIGRGQLSALCRAVGVLTPRDTGELHNKPLIIKLAVSDNPEYGKRNEVKAYKSVNAAPSPMTRPPAATAAAVASDESPF